MAIQFLWGAIAATSAVAGLCFLRCWRTSRDRFFLIFAIALFVLASNWVFLAALQPSAEERPYAYLPRLAAFALIIAGIVDKNHQR